LLLFIFGSLLFICYSDAFSIHNLWLNFVGVIMLNLKSSRSFTNAALVVIVSSVGVSCGQKSSMSGSDEKDKSNAKSSSDSQRAEEGEVSFALSPAIVVKYPKSATYGCDLS
jgi:hypothetical protein